MAQEWQPGECGSPTEQVTALVFGVRVHVRRIDMTFDPSVVWVLTERRWERLTHFEAQEMAGTILLRRVAEVDA